MDTTHRHSWVPLSVLQLDLLDRRIDDEDPGVVLLRVRRHEVEAPAVGGILLREAPDLFAILELDDGPLAGSRLASEAFRPADLQAGLAVVLHGAQRLNYV